MKKQVASQDEITGLRDLTLEQREDVEAMCDDGLMPSAIGRRLGLPTQVCADARRAWQRQKQLDAVTTPATPQPAQLSANDTLGQMMIMSQQTMQQQMLRAQIDALLEQNRHTKEANKLEERERRIELAERESQYREDYAPEPTKDTTLDAYNFEEDPLGAVMRFGKELKSMSAADGNRSPTIDATNKAAPELTDEAIAAYVAKQPPQTIGKALAAIDTPYHDELVNVLNKQGITGKNLEKTLNWLRAEKKRRSEVKK